MSFLITLQCIFLEASLTESGVELTGLARLAREQAYSCLPGTGILDCIARVFYKGIVSLNSGSLVCVASTLFTEQSPQPKDKDSLEINEQYIVLCFQD